MAFSADDCETIKELSRTLLFDYIEELKNENKYIGEIAYTLEKTKKCFVGLSAVKEFTPSIRIVNKNEKICFSLSEWYEFMQLKSKINDFFKNRVTTSTLPELEMNTHKFKFMIINGVKYMQVYHYSLFVTFTKKSWEKLENIANLLYKHLEVLEMRCFYDYYNTLLQTAFSMNSEDDVLTTIHNLCQDSKTDNALCVQEAIYYARNKVISDYVNYKALTCQLLKSTFN